MVLTPTKPVPAEWFLPYLQNGKMVGVKLLGLASGGGQQMPVFAALGADCTVLDYSEKQLDRLTAAIKAGEIGAVLVTNISRIARNFPLYAEWSAILGKFGVKLSRPQL